MKFVGKRVPIENVNSTSPLGPALLTVKNILENTVTIDIIALVQTLLEEANTYRASDIHIEPSENSVRVRLRIDGLLIEKYTFTKTLLPEIISRLKVLSGLRTDEHQAAQDGRFQLQTNTNQVVDIRISITPTYYGENVVLRLLSDHASEFTLEKLGFCDADRLKITEAIAQPYGMILATGPTGSGKTTTLYTLIKLLNKENVSIVTVEDPVEYAISGITQIQINPRVNLTFQNGLRSILRQDPNIIMVGEIRDSETANIAINTALTGHLLLSTLHTNDSASTLPRLLDMGIDAYLVASTINVSIGQRLVRKICPSCREVQMLSKVELEHFKSSLPIHLKNKNYILPNQFYKSVGCFKCDLTGFSGRVGIYEVMVISDKIKEAILKRESASTLKNIAIEEGMSTMFEDGIKKAGEGLTTLTEVLRTINQ